MTFPSTPTQPADAPAVLILGAAGRIGAAATTAFAAAGWRVLAQARRPLGALPAGVEPLAIDLADTDGLAKAATGVRAVLYAVNPLYTRWPQELLPLARQGMDVAERLGARLLLPGNLYNQGTTLPPLVDERTPQRADTRKGRLRVQLEDELAARATAGRLRSTVLRAGDFYGCAPGTWLDQAIVKSLPQGKLVYPGPLDRPHAWAYLPDLARAFVAVAALDDRPAHERWGYAGHTLTGAELLAAIEHAARYLGFEPARGWRHAGMPWPLIRALGWVVPMMRELAEMAYLWERPHAIDGTELEAAIGPLPCTPVGEAIRATLGAVVGGRESPGTSTSD